MVKKVLANESGYTLVALLALIAVSGILMASIAPTWSYLVTRDKEEELIFRGHQYTFAISLYQSKYSKLPNKLEELVKYRMIRRLFKDPITGSDFELILQGPDGKKRESELTKSQRESLRGKAPGGSTLGIVGVVSTSSKTAIRPYKEKEKYNEWEFLATESQDGGSNDDNDDNDDEADESAPPSTRIKPKSTIR